MAIFYSSLGKLVQSYLYLCYQDEEIEVERGKVFFKVHSYRPAEMRFRSGPVSFWRLRSLWRQDPPRGPQRETSSGSQCKLGRIQMLSPYMRMPTHWIWGRAMFADKHPGGLRYSVAVKDGTEGWSFHPAWMPTLKIQIMQYKGKNRWTQPPDSKLSSPSFSWASPQCCYVTKEWMVAGKKNIWAGSKPKSFQLPKGFVKSFLIPRSWSKYLTLDS